MPHGKAQGMPKATRPVKAMWQYAQSVKKFDEEQPWP